MDANDPLLEELFHAARSVPAGSEREAWMGMACREAPELRAKLEALLRMDADENFLAEPSGPGAAQPLGEQPGDRIGPYKLLQPIGEGGFGTVWMAEQREPVRRRVALKILKLGMDTKEVIARFEAERQALALMDHPNIARVIEAGATDSGRPYFAMDLVNGLSIVQHCDEERLDTRARLELFREVCLAIQHAHQRGIIHRDIKPSNVLVTMHDGLPVPRVIDFGIAKATNQELTERTLFTVFGQMIGSPLYMAPEQAERSALGIDTRADVYSLGVLLYELLTGTTPFGMERLRQASHEELVRTIREEEPHRPSTRVSSLGETATTTAARHRTDARTLRSMLEGDLDWIVMRCLEKDRTRRYQSAGALADDVQRYLDDEPVSARPPSTRYRLEKLYRRYKKTVIAAAVLLLVLVLGIIGTTWGMLWAIDEKDRADHEASAAKVSAQVATQRSDDVLRLSALQRLDDLADEADRLWPAHPRNIEPYQRWLGKAEALVAELPDHEGKLAELRAKSRPRTEEEQAELRATHPRAMELVRLERELAFLRGRMQALESGEPGSEPTAAEVGVDLSALPTEAAALDALAWPLIHPDRTSFGDERKGLLLAQRAVELDGAADRAQARDTLAWALLALGRLDEAAAASEQALEEATEDQQAEYEQHLAKLHEAIEAELEPEAFEGAEQRLSELEAQRAAIETELARVLTFDDDQDRWWYNQLDKLVQGIRLFADEQTGLLSEGTSEAHGWGVRRRLSNARLLREGFAPDGEQTQAWARALPGIRAAYPELALTVQFGLVPIGPDPDSMLWEFAQLETGKPPVRGADGKLVVTEETGLVLVLLPGGTFRMGAQKSDPSGPNYDPHALIPERPVHTVTLSPFFLSKYEMTQAQWQRLMGRNPSAYGPPIKPLVNPVEQVSWISCMQVLQRLGLTLPSEAQWEYGARGGKSTPWWTGSERVSLLGALNVADQAAARIGGMPWEGIADFPELDDGSVAHARVDAFRPNPFGLHNVHGNVWEWCLDDLDFGFYARPATQDPVSNGGSYDRVMRGGGFDGSVLEARSACRADRPRDSVHFSLGLRPARAIEP